VSEPKQTETQRLESWLAENLGDLIFCAIVAYQQSGRGTVVLDSTKMAGRSFHEIRAAGIEPATC
jgi:hypothetical protein